MSKPLDERLEYVLAFEGREGASTHAWFLLAVVAVRALIAIAVFAEEAYLILLRDFRSSAK